MNRYEEDEFQGASWISVRSLIKESKINSIYSKRTSESSIDPSPPGSKTDSSITMEWKPNTYINQSISFSSMHDNYCKDIHERCQSQLLETDTSNLSRDIEAMKYYIERSDSKYRKLQKSSNREIMNLKEELSVQSSKVAEAESETARLAALIELMKTEHAQQLQNMQARHERKLQKSKHDLDSLLSDINEKTANYVSEKLRASHEEEIERIRDYYEERIEEIRVEHELEINEGVIDDEKLEELYREIEEYKRLIENNEKRYNKEISTLKRLANGKREENGKVEDCQLINKVRALEEELAECKETIESYEKTIDELSKELQGTFKKKKRNTEDGLEGDLQRLLGQINSYIDYSDFASSKELGETLKSLQSKIELLTSGKISL